VYDVSGAGDTVAATLAAGIGAGLSIEDSAQIANIAAGIVVGKVGTAVIHRAEIIEELRQRRVTDARSKVLPCPDAAERVSRWQRLGLTVGFVSGWFNALRAGDVALLEQAKARCDRLVIGLHGDASGRTMQDAEARSLVLASLQCVDLLVVFDEPTPEAVIRALRPQVLAGYVAEPAGVSSGS
jgi:D-beta-D-heptose 7-phosphate kinase/D-beta-D-heptose 1-phosphate adenosyltransferase